MDGRKVMVLQQSSRVVRIYILGGKIRSLMKLINCLGRSFKKMKLLNYCNLNANSILIKLIKLIKANKIHLCRLGSYTIIIWN